MSLVDNKISLLVNNQLPEFIREDYQTFVSFIEAYYEFLENKQANQDNDLYRRAKELVDIKDVDLSLDDFEEQFFNTFLELFPRDVESSKSLLIKNATPFYLAKGNEKSFRFFFRTLYGEEIEIETPRNNILIASGGNWKVQRVLRADAKSIYSYYTSNVSTFDGSVSNTKFYLAQESTPDDIVVYVDGVLKTSSDFYTQKEYKKIVFNSPVSSGSLIKVVYKNFDRNLLLNRKITGKTSGAYGIIEDVSSYNNFNTDIFEFQLDYHTIRGDFSLGEDFITDVLDQNESPIAIQMNSTSKVVKITVTDGGYSYNVGDPAIVSGGDPSIPATAVISAIYSGVYDKINVAYGGAGFVTGYPILPTSSISPYSMNAAIFAVDTSGTSSPSSVKINNNLIWDLANVSINTANYKANGVFVSATAALINANSRLIDAFTYTTISDVGPITQGFFYDSNVPQANTLTLNALGANVFVTNVSAGFSRYAPIELIGSIGRVDILSQGAGYQVGDKLIFTPIPAYTLGYGAAGAVTEVDASGGIHKIELQPFAYSSNTNYSVSVTSGSNNITGNNTNFNVDFKVGYNVIVFNQTRTITGITSNTLMNVSAAFTTSKSNTEIGLYDLYPIGGWGYSQDYLPDVSVSSTTGVGAVLKATSIMGTGEILIPEGTYKQGQIQTITIVNPGLGYKAVPTIDLTGSGSKTAQAYANIQLSYYEYDGKYTDTGGHLSSDKKIQDSAYYNTGSYVLKTKQQFSRYKSALLKLLHPSGSVAYSEYLPTEKSISSGKVNLLTSTVEKGVSTPVLDLDFTLGTLNTSFTTSETYNIYTSNAASNTSIVSFIRPSNATYVGSDGYIKTAGINQPRFNYNAVTKQNKGILLEDTSTNLVANSGNLAADSWSSRGLISKSTVPNAALGPDGTQSMTYFKVPSTARSLYANSFASATNIIFVQNQGISPIILSNTSSYYWNVSGQGIATGTYVVSANNSNNFLLLSTNTTAAGGNGTNDTSNTANTLTFTFSSAQAIYGNDGITLSNNTTYTVSAFFKLTNPREISSFIFGLLGQSYEGSGYAYGQFDLANNIVTNVGSGGSNTSATITDYGNQIYRLAVRATTNTLSGAAATTTNYPGIQLLTAYTGTNLYNPEASGLVGKGLYVWGMQVEQRDAPSSYIPTTTAAATRVSDIFTISGSNFTNWFNQTEGTFNLSMRVNHSIRYVSTAFPLLVNKFPSYNNMYQLRAIGQNVGADPSVYGAIDILVLKGGSVVVDSPGFQGWGPSSAGINNSSTPITFSFGYKANNFGSTLSGQSIQSSTFPLNNVPDGLDNLYLAFPSNQISIDAQRLTYYPYRLSNNALQYITGNTTISL